MIDSNSSDLGLEPIFDDYPENFRLIVHHLRTFDGPPNPNDPLVRQVGDKTFIFCEGRWLRYRSRAETERLAAIGRAAVDSHKPIN